MFALTAEKFGFERAISLEAELAGLQQDIVHGAAAGIIRQRRSFESR